MSIHSIKSLLLLAVIGSGLVACSPGKPCSDPLGCLELDRGQSLTIGVAVPLTGPDRPAGEAALALVQQIAGQKKSIAGHPLRVQKTDFDCSAGPSELSAERLTGETTLTGVIAAGCLLNLPLAQNAFNQAGVPVLVQSVPGPTAIPGPQIIGLSPQQGGWDNPAIDPVFTRRAVDLYLTAITAVSTAQDNGTLQIPRQGLQTELTKLVQPSTLK